MSHIRWGGLMSHIRWVGLDDTIFWSKSVKIRPLPNHSKCTPHSTREFEFFNILDLPSGVSDPFLWDLGVAFFFPLVIFFSKNPKVGRFFVPEKK